MSADHVTRLPRVSLPPISGRDRRHYAREAARAPQNYLSMMQGAERKRAEAERLVREADRAECEAWCGALMFGLEVERSPTLAQALNAGFDQIEVQCRRCRQLRLIPIKAIRRDPNIELWNLEHALSCQPCRADIDALPPGQRGFGRPRAIITGLRLASGSPPDEPAPTTPTAKRSTC